MESRSPIKMIKSNHPDMTSNVEEKLTEALNILNENGFLDTFSDENLEALYKIEMIDTGYFAGLSRAAAMTMISLHEANPGLSVTLLLETTDSLARRKRPWESLNAFSKIAIACPKQINQEMLIWLSKVKCDYLEIASYDIADQTQKSKKESSGVIGILSSFLYAQPVEVDIKKAVNNVVHQDNCSFSY